MPSAKRAFLKALAAGTGRLTFLLFGLGGAILGLVAADAVWRKRLRGVRRFLLGGTR